MNLYGWHHDENIPGKILKEYEKCRMKQQSRFKQTLNLSSKKQKYLQLRPNFESLMKTRYQIGRECKALFSQYSMEYYSMNRSFGFLIHRKN
jgi:hypothetical protein